MFKRLFKAFWKGPEMANPSNIETMSELHKSGLISDEDMKSYVKQYAEHLMNPLIAIDPSQQLPFGSIIQQASRIHRKDGSQKMHAHTIQAPAPGAHSHTLSSGVGQARVPLPFIPEKEELRRTLGVRLRARPGDVFPLEFIDFHVASDKVYVFCVAKEGATIIEDDIGLFPSDALITAIKLLAG